MDCSAVDASADGPALSVQQDTTLRFGVADAGSMAGKAHASPPAHRGWTAAGPVRRLRRMHPHTLCRLAFTAFTAVCGPAAAASFDFEAVAPPAFTGTLVPDGYAGAHWSGFVLRRTTDFASGGSNGFVVNNTTMALGTEATPTISFDTPVVFDGAFIGSNSITGTPTIGYELFLGPTLVASGVVGFSAGNVASGWGGAIDRIVFHEAVATDRLSLDAIVLTSAVPEPGSGALWLAGAALAVFMRRRAPGAGP